MIQDDGMAQMLVERVRMCVAVLRAQFAFRHFWI
jgi:hypothetical protein